ncbi:ycgG [Fusarium acutatum]|uniref:YcgG n=1 Tax=Fusarium acutatum TaxID=78861 RepID=A0A8H4NSV4_9HYPO|nr:ycgG [Fusarium acutatum]
MPASKQKEALLRTDDVNETRSSSQAELLTRNEVESRFDKDTWQGLAYQDFKSTILAKGSGMKTFPCVYATMGYRSDDHRYVFLHSENPSEPRNVRKVALALAAYLRISTSLGPNTSLVIICAPSEKQRTVEEHNQTFWDMLRGLRICDPRPWPEDIPQDTEDAKWTFCFNGEAVFPVMLTPAHQKRWSRHMSVPVIAMQPKWVLDNLLGTPEKRKAAQSKVRSLLQKYDTIGVSPDLTAYGATGTSEARQLCLQDKNESVQCPYRNFDS